MQFRLDDKPFAPQILDEGEIESPHTGARLRTLQISFRVREADSAWVTDHLKTLERGGLFSGEPASGDEVEWRLTNSSYSYQSNAQTRVYTYTWQLQQVERFSATSIEVGSLVLTPYAYAERADPDGRIEIRSRSVVDEGQLNQIGAIESGGAPVTVIRHGVNPEPRSMELRSYVWSRSTDGLKVELDLADPSATDDDTPPKRRESWVPYGLTPKPLLYGLSYRAEVMDELLTTLQQKGVLTEEEARRVTDIPNERVERRAVRWYEVNDVDFWTID